MIPDDTSQRIDQKFPPLLSVDRTGRRRGAGLRGPPRVPRRPGHRGAGHRDGRQEDQGDAAMRPIHHDSSRQPCNGNEWIRKSMIYGT